MLLTSYFLAALAIALAWPTPFALSRAKWPARSPVAAVLLWQGIALAGGLSMIGAMLVWGLSPLGDDLVTALQRGWQLLIGERMASSLGLLHLFALITAALFAFHLVLTLIRAAWRITRQRARHRELLGLLSNPSSLSPNTLVLEHDIPVAYCVPGLTRSVTVLSRGLLDQLTEQEQHAVLAHERSHLDQRHDLLILAFTAWHEALPWLPTSRLALDAVRQLIEMLADDEALKTVERPVLLRAIVTVAASIVPVPDGRQPDTPAGASDLEGLPTGELSSSRLQRLLSESNPLGPVQRVLVLLSTLLLLVLPTILLLSPRTLG